MGNYVDLILEACIWKNRKAKAESGKVHITGEPELRKRCGK